MRQKALFKKLGKSTVARGRLQPDAVICRHGMLASLTMPELRECIASHMLASWGFQHFLHTRESSTCTVQQIYYDLTTVEGNATPNYNGLPRTLTTNSSVRRGSGKAQTPLAPTVPLCSLVLRSIETTYRALILDFTVAYFQVVFHIQWTLVSLPHLDSVSTAHLCSMVLDPQMGQRYYEYITRGLNSHLYRLVK